MTLEIALWSATRKYWSETEITEADLAMTDKEVVKRLLLPAWIAAKHRKEAADAVYRDQPA